MDHFGSELHDRSAYLRDLQDGKVTTLQQGYYKYTVGDQRFPYLLKGEIRNQERDLEALRGDLKTAQKLVSSWTPQPLPETGKAPQRVPGFMGWLSSLSI